MKTLSEYLCVNCDSRFLVDTSRAIFCPYCGGNQIIDEATWNEMNRNQEEGDK